MREPIDIGWACGIENLLVSIRKSENVIIYGGRKTRGRPKQIWMEAIKEAIGMEVILNQTAWKNKIYIANTKILG